MKLYHYIHCPFCVRVRMACGFLKISYESIVVPYHDEKTPIELTGVKMLPIMKIQDRAINESLEIIKTIDEKNLLQNQLAFGDISQLIVQLASPIHNLCMPYWIWGPEFDDHSRQYFTAKKTAKRGPFHLLIGRRKEFEKELALVLEDFEQKLGPYYESSELTIKDIMIAAHLWGLFILPEFQFSSAIYQYLMKIKKACAFEYYSDYQRADFFKY